MFWKKNKNHVNDMQFDILVSKTIDFIVDMANWIERKNEFAAFMAEVKRKVDMPEFNQCVVEEIKYRGILEELRKLFVNKYLRKDTVESDFLKDTPDVLRLKESYFIPNINEDLEYVERALKTLMVVLEDKDGRLFFNDTVEECNEFDYLSNLLKSGYKVCNVNGNTYFCRRKQSGVREWARRQPHSK